MFKSFSGRFFAIYTVATVVLFILLFSVFSQMMTRYFVESKYDAMIQESKSISEQYIETYYMYRITDVSFRYYLQTLSRHLGLRIFAITSDGLIYRDSNDSGSLEGTRLENELVTKVLSNQVATATGSFYDMFDKQVITAGVPVIVEGEVVGAILMHSPYPLLKRDIDYIYRLTLMSLLVILAMTFASTYLFSRSVSKTFEEFSNTARSIANGDFSSRVHVLQEGETGELAKNMNYMAQELEKLEDMRKDFIANISHDFRSPLTSIRGFVQAILDGTIPQEKESKYLNIVLDETDRLTKLTNDILMLTKMENNNMPLELSDFDIHTVIRKVLLQFEQKIISKNIDLTFLIERPEIITRGDVNQIQRVVSNLVDNALKFCSTDDAITIETSIVRNKVEVSIKDSGPGISEDDIKFIWDRFHKADRSRGKDKKGIGLGLSIVREIIRAHDESINVYSQEGKGTKFVFTLTLAPEKS